jgi:hypothetical protein
MILSALVFPDLLHEVHTSESHNTKLAPDSHRRPLQDQRCTNALLSHHYSTKFTQVPAKKILSLQAIYIARKHKHAPHQNAHKSADFQFCLVSLSLFHPSTAARLVTRRSGITLAFNQAPSHRQKKTQNTLSLAKLLYVRLFILLFSTNRSISSTPQTPVLAQNRLYS